MIPEEAAHAVRTPIIGRTLRYFGVFGQAFFPIRRRHLLRPSHPGHLAEYLIGNMLPCQSWWMRFTHRS